MKPIFTLFSIFLALGSANAAIYDLGSLLNVTYVDYCSIVYSEGPMFKSAAKTNTSYIRAVGTAEVDAPDQAVNIYFIFLHSMEKIQTWERACAPNGGTFLSGVDNFVSSIVPVHAVGGKIQPFDVLSPIPTNDAQGVMVCTCPSDESSADSVKFTGSLEYKNPHGFLPATRYGTILLTGIVGFCYLAILLVYVWLTIKKRELIVGLQLAILVVIVMGLIENLSWYFTYLGINLSGEPQCCPVKNAIVFCLFLKDVKKCVSAMLVLSVSLGLGVLKPNLPMDTKFKIAVLGGLYLMAAVTHDFENIIDVNHNRYETGDNPTSALLVAVCDVIFLFWINHGLSKTTVTLMEGRQHAKLKMYKSLTRTLFFWSALWVVYTLVLVAAHQGIISIPWEYDFLLVGFWDLLYFGILASIAYIWAPSETAAAYAFSTQLPTEDPDDDGFEKSLEMNAPETATHFEIGEDDLEDDDDFEDEIEMVLGTSKQAKDEVTNT